MDLGSIWNISQRIDRGGYNSAGEVHFVIVVGRSWPPRRESLVANEVGLVVVLVASSTALAMGAGDHRTNIRFAIGPCSGLW